MNSAEATYELIERYLDGAMSGQEKSVFEEQLLADTELASTFDAYKIARQIVVGKEALALKEQMVKDFAGGYDPVLPRRTPVWKYIVYAAAAGTIALLYYFWQKDTKTKDTPAPQEIRKEHPLPDTTAPVGKEIEMPVDTGLADVQDTLLSNQAVAHKEQESKQDPGIVCDDQLISFSCQARGACAQREDGAIEIDVNTIKSGKAPFAFSVTPGGVFNEEPVISGLKPGKYHLYVKDARQCVRKLNVKVEVPLIQCGP